MMEFYAGYMVEMSLSLDNLFAFYLVFKYFKVHPEHAQNRVLFWGILGAILLRGVMVLCGSAIIHTFRPLLLVCAVVLIFSAYQVLLVGEDDDDDEDLTNNACVLLAEKIIPVGRGYHGSDFVHEGQFTPLILCSSSLSSLTSFSPWIPCPPSLESPRTQSLSGLPACAQFFAFGLCTHLSSSSCATSPT